MKKDGLKTGIHEQTHRRAAEIDVVEHNPMPELKLRVKIRSALRS